MNQFEYVKQFEVGATVADLTAIAYGWEDTEGVVVDVDGSSIRVRYPSGKERWKRCINLTILQKP